MKAKEICKKYYPKLWGIGRIRNLVKIGRITREEYKEITGEDYDRKEA
ncbi:XkdX family protein [Acetivibrio ethanolgignens]|nr:XkdX family protein [Acetivibrio ethanolgignens]